jgi:FkbM family methyltransferase
MALLRRLGQGADNGTSQTPARDPAQAPPSPVRPWVLINPKQLFESDNLADAEDACRRLAFAAYVGDDTVLCRTLARYKMYVSTKDMGLAPHLIADGYWELWTTQVMAQLVQPGMVCVDAGANIGYYTLLMADLAGPEGRVVATEPMPATRAYLRRNVDINGFGGNTKVIAAAFGAQPGEVTLYMPPGEPKNALICDHCPDPTWEKATVPLMRIDDLDLARVDFVKIDVEGAEMAVWSGMQQTVEANPELKIMMEVNWRRYPDAAADFIAGIEARYPLRHIDFSGRTVPIAAADVLAAPDDVMLYLAKD